MMGDHHVKFGSSTSKGLGVHVLDRENLPPHIIHILFDNKGPTTAGLLHVAIVLTVEHSNDKNNYYRARNKIKNIQYIMSWETRPQNVIPFPLSHHIS